ncbi:ELWxxDGT repeat protein [Runella sp.]|uniref:ELWxxDGT repeat protein n=1 Tax=Runella sp. TaxID=1960881 RepID=UPI003D0C9F0B
MNKRVHFWAFGGNDLLRRTSYAFFYFVILVVTGPIRAQTPVLLKDINTLADPILPGTTLGSDPRFLVDHKGTLFFTAKEKGTAVGLWKSNGSTNGTVKITDLPNTVSGLISVGNLLYFAADQSGFGYELWKSNGTAAGTVRVKDIYPGSLGSMPEGFTNVNGTLYFVATNATNGSELWKSDGTEAGTVIVKDIVSGTPGSNPQGLTNVNGTLYFVADDGVNGYELWKSDGTAAGTALVKDINPGNSSSSPQHLINVSGTLYFVANNGVNGYELWKSNGTATGTTLVKDILSGSKSSMPQFLTEFKGSLCFSANNGVNGYQLWKSDGTENGTALVSDMQGGSIGSSPQYLKNIGGNLYFSATNGITGREFWKSDGTSAGTFMVRNISPGGEWSASTPLLFTDGKGIVYFTADDGENGRELWKSDGKEESTTALTELRPGKTGSGISNMMSVADTVYFTADDGKKGSEVWKLVPCATVKLASTDTTICHKGPYSLSKMVTNSRDFVTMVWRRGSLAGPIVDDPENAMLTEASTDFYVAAQMSSGCSSNAKITITTIPYPERVGGLYVVLEGAYQKGVGTMSTLLNQKGLLPGQTPIKGLATPARQPYYGSPWFYDGNETMSSYPANATDWILVSLRTGQNDPSTTVFKAAAVLLKDGSSVVKGCPSKLKNYTNYYVAIEHRNHIGIVSATPTLFLYDSFFYDFGIQQSYLPPGVSSIGQKHIDNRYMMYAGDLQKAKVGEINANDVIVWQQQNGQFGRYLAGDANLDGEVNALDQILWLLNNGLFTGVRF